MSLSIFTGQRPDGAAPARGLYPLDLTRDLSDVVRLIEEGFAGELDPQGRAMLAQMQELTRRPAWWLKQNAYELQLEGFVWRENGRVVGNASLRRAAPWSNGGWMIGNVVVDEAYRGRGIGRALMQACLLEAQRKGGRWVGLEVRSNNTPARTLYEHLGFTAVGEMIHWLHPGRPPLPHRAKPASSLWRAARPEDAPVWYNLACHIHPSPQRDVLELRPQTYRYGGLERTLTLWLEGQREWAWLERQPVARLAVYVRMDWRYRYYLWTLLVDPARQVDGAAQALERALSAVGHWKPWPVITYTPLNSPLNALLAALGFAEHRRLIQMMVALPGSAFFEVSYA